MRNSLSHRPTGSRFQSRLTSGCERMNGRLTPKPLPSVCVNVSSLTCVTRCPQSRGEKSVSDELRSPAFDHTPTQTISHRHRRTDEAVKTAVHTRLRPVNWKAASVSPTSQRTLKTLQWSESSFVQESGLRSDTSNYSQRLLKEAVVLHHGTRNSRDKKSGCLCLPS